LPDQLTGLSIDDFNDNSFCCVIDAKFKITVGLLKYLINMGIIYLTPSVF